MTSDALLARLWAHLDGDASRLDAVTFTGPAAILPSVFDVTGFAAASVAAANLAVAEFAAVLTGSERPAPVTVDRREAAAAFACERLTTPIGWRLPPVWDPIAGDYETADGWIRLHTNYAHHRDVALSVLGTAGDRTAVAAVVRGWCADDLEEAVVDAGGCAAAMRTIDGWRAHPAGIATADEVPVALVVDPEGSEPARSASAPRRAGPMASRPLTGVRVLDLTRVIAGPVATRFLAAHGADVLRIDPPGFEEVGALLPETTLGKRCASVDLTGAAGRETFKRLVSEADVVVSGLRPGAMAALGYDPRGLRALNPRLVTVTHDAYGWDGPWAGRRGFDSLVQMSTGIAAAGGAAVGSSRPSPLPVQALDHGTGFLLAAGAVRALTRRLIDGVVGEVRGSLVGAANVVLGIPVPLRLDLPSPAWTDDDTEPRDSAWGPLRQALVPGRVDGRRAGYDPDRAAGDLGRHSAVFPTAVSAARAV